MDPRLKACFCLQIAALSGYRKTVWVKKFLENVGRVVDRKVDEIVYCYGEYQPLFDEMQQMLPQIQFIVGSKFIYERLASPF